MHLRSTKKILSKLKKPKKLSKKMTNNLKKLEEMSHAHVAAEKNTNIVVER
jgi:hypothetical protein